MKYMRQFAIILAVTCAGELMRFCLPLPIPASIYGLLLMLLLLCTGAIKLESVKDTSALLLAWMPLMFIGPMCALITVWDDLVPILIPLIVISIVTTVLTMGATGCTAQAIIRLEGRRKK